eukprot:5940126-Amphidinium_carterae.1
MTGKARGCVQNSVARSDAQSRRTWKDLAGRDALKAFPSRGLETQLDNERMLESTLTIETNKD